MELWNMLNVVLRYGSFSLVKRAEALDRAGSELGAAVRAFTSECVLDAKEHIQKLQVLHPHEDPSMMFDSLDNMHGDSSSHAPNPSLQQTSGGLCKKCKTEESSRCTKVEGRHHQAK